MPLTYIIILVSIVLAIAIGYKLDVNIGLLCIAFAYLLGVCLVDLPPNNIIAMWPTKLFFQLMTIGFFYSIAIVNGTLELVARKIVYHTKQVPFLIPFALWFMLFFLASIGPGAISMFLSLTPLLMTIAVKINMTPLMGTIIMVAGSSAGGWSPLAVQGILTRTLIEASGHTAAESFRLSLIDWRNMAVSMFLFFVLSYFLFKAYKCKPSHIQDKETFSPKQRLNIILICIMLAILIIPAALGALTGSVVLTQFAGKIDITFVAVTFSVLAITLRVGDERKAMTNVPWGTIIMLCGTGMLLEVASEAGLLEYLATYLAQNYSAAILPYAIATVAGVMSVFSSATGVVMPTLYPLVTSICAISGVSAPLLFSIIPIAAASTGMSPFSTAGGLTIASIDDDKQAKKVFLRLNIVALIALAFILLSIGFGIIS